MYKLYSCLSKKLLCACCSVDVAFLQTCFKNVYDISSSCLSSSVNNLVLSLRRPELSAQVNGDCI